MSMRTDDSPRSRSRSPQLPSRREDQARYSVEVPLLSEPTVPKHSSQGSVNTNETVNSSNPSNIVETVKIDEASERQGETSEHPREISGYLYSSSRSNVTRISWIHLKKR